MEQSKQKDLCLIKNMAQELELSPWDIFLHWVKQGKIQKVTVNITYQNGDVIEADVTKLCSLSASVSQNVTEVASQEEVVAAVTKIESPHNSAPLLSTTKSIPDTGSFVTSVKHGTIRIKAEQLNNVKIGAYVYSTGDILTGYKTLGPTQIKGVILSHSKESITLIKYIGSDLTAMDSVAQIKDDWRFLTYNECRKMVKYQDILNVRLAEMRVKQIKDPAMLLYKENNNQLHVMDVGTQEVHSTPHDKTVGISRTFTVYLAKDLKIV